MFYDLPYLDTAAPCKTTAAAKLQEAAHSGLFCSSLCGDDPGTATIAHQLTLAPLPGILRLPFPAVPPAVRTPVKALPGVVMPPPILRRPCLPRCAQVVVVTFGQLSLPATAATDWPQTSEPCLGSGRRCAGQSCVVQYSCS